MAKTPVAKTQALTSWDAELAASAVAVTKQMEALATGSFISIKAGVISIDGSPVPGNQLGVVIAAHVHEHAYYEDDYDPDNPASPVCFAFGDDQAKMAPHEKSTDPQYENCAKCPQNQFGSATKGKGKACKNVMRIAILNAGTFTKGGDFEPILDPEVYATMAPRFYRIPVMSVRGFAGFVTATANAQQRPPWGVFTRISTVPDEKSQFKVVFEFLDVWPNELGQVMSARHKELMDSIGFPYAVFEQGEEKPVRKTSKAKFKR